MSSFVRHKKKKGEDPKIRILSIISIPQRAVKKDPPQNKSLKNQGLSSAQATWGS